MYIMAAGNEREAFMKYHQLFGASTYLVDTYDTLEGVQNALDVAGEGVSSVRLDSGDLAQLSRDVRALLHQRGRDDVKITLSSDLDEYEIERLNREGDFDIAGVGTRVATSEDAPSLGGVYKLVEIEGRPVAKFSASKVTYPGPHQVYRHEKAGLFTHDHVGLVKEATYELVDATPLLVPVVTAGKVVHHERIHDMRARCRAGMAKLPAALKVIGPRTPSHEAGHETHYEVRPSDQLHKLLQTVREQARHEHDKTAHTH
jgi:nicotinate phosphoribosyltransferase